MLHHLQYVFFLNPFTGRVTGNWICAFLHALPAFTWLPLLHIVRDIWMSAGYASFKVIARGAVEWKSEEQSQRGCGVGGGIILKGLEVYPPSHHSPTHTIYTYTHPSHSLHTYPSLCFRGWWVLDGVSWFCGPGVWFLPACKPHHPTTPSLYLHCLPS